MLSVLPIATAVEEFDHGRMVPSQMLKELADQRSAALRELGAPRNHRVAWLRLPSARLRLRPPRLRSSAVTRATPEPSCAL